MQLILNTFGTSLRKKDDTFIVHHKDGKQKVSADTVKNISVMKGTSISADAMILAIENEIEVLVLDRSGMPRGRLWSNKYGSISTIRKHQVYFGQSSSAVDFVKKIISEKIYNQGNYLKTISLKLSSEKNIGELELSVQKINNLRNKILDLKAAHIKEIDQNIRGFEGSASREYFKQLSKILPSRYVFEKRSRRPAKDMFNCVLNYTYGMLYGRIEGALIKAGIDPYLGIFHRDEYNRPVLVYDFIEIYRIFAEISTMELCKKEIIDKDLFSITRNGGYWLETTGRKIVIENFNEYLNTVVQKNGKRRTRIVHINDHAHSFAKELLNFQCSPNEQF